jgi:MFS family permease
MTATPASASAFPLARFLTVLLAGPLLGTLLFITAILIPGWQFEAGALPFDLLQMLAIGYLFGLTPSGIAGACAALFATRFAGRRAQYIAAIPLGALAGVAGMFVVVLQLQATDYFGLPFYLISALAGALALPACTWLFDRLVEPRLRKRD